MEVFLHKYNDLSPEDQIQKILENPKMDKANAVFISAPEEVAWLTNLRCHHMQEFDPIFNSFALVCKDG